MNRRSFLSRGITAIVAAAEASSEAATHIAPGFDNARLIHEVQPRSSAHNIQVVSWNIDRGSRESTVAAALASLDADVMLLQEVDWNTQRSGGTDVAAKLCAELRRNGAYGIEFEELSQEHQSPAYIGQVTLTRLPLVHSRILRFRTQSDFWKPRPWIPSSLPLMQRRQGSRIALVTELKFARGKLVVYNTHLESRSVGFVQSAQLDEILRDAAQYPAEIPILLGGDLNTKYFPARFLHKLERAGFRSALGENIQRTHRIAMALDWLFVRGPARWSDGRVDRDVRGSDHFAVVAALAAG